MAQQTLNNSISGLAFRKILNDNFTDLYTNKADKMHASTTTEYGVASTTNFGHIKINTNNGLSINGGILGVSKASTSQSGTVQLVDNATTNDNTKAATASALKFVKDSAIIAYQGTDVPSQSLGKNGDIYIKTI